MFEVQDKVQPMRQRPTRLPKMGVTSVTSSAARTSTPKTDLASPKSPKLRNPDPVSPKSPSFRKSGVFDYDNGNDEPIYCEIGTPGKSPKRSTPNFESPGQKSSNLVRNSYLRHSAGLSNFSENASKGPNLVAMNYRRQTSATNSENNFRAGLSSVRSELSRNALNNNNSNTSSNIRNNNNGNNIRYDPNSKEAIRTNFLFGKTDSILSSRLQNGQNDGNSNRPQYNHWAQRYRLSSTDDFETGSNPAGQNRNFPPTRPDRNRVDNSPARSIFDDPEMDPSPIFRAPVAPRMSRSANGLGRRAHTQLEISTERYRQQISEPAPITRVICPEVRRLGTRLNEPRLGLNIRAQANKTRNFWRAFPSETEATAIVLMNSGSMWALFIGLNISPTQ